MTRKWIPLALLLLLVPLAGPAQETGDDTEMEAEEASMQEDASDQEEPTAPADLEYGAEGYDWSGVVQQPRWILRGFLGRAQTGGEQAVVDNSQGAVIDRWHLGVDNGVGAGLALEWRASCLIGLEPSIARYQLDSHLMFDSATEWLMDDEDIDLDILALGLNFHVTPKSPVDFYLGPVIAWARGNDTDYSLDGSLGSFNSDWGDDFAFGAQLGLDVPASGGWAFNANVKYLNGISLESDSVPGLDADIDPFLLNAGFAYRWGRDRGPWCGTPVALPPPPPPPAPEPTPEPPPPPPPPPAPEPPKEIRETCTFASGSARVDNICQAKLDEVALQMQDDPELDAEVVGYTDSTGAPESNQVMSERRAEAVSEYLVTRHGIDPNRITTEGRADQEPVASNDTPEGRAENRRAVIILTTE